MGSLSDLFLHTPKSVDKKMDKSRGLTKGVGSGVFSDITPFLTPAPPPGLEWLPLVLPWRAGRSYNGTLMTNKRQSLPLHNRGRYSPPPPVQSQYRPAVTWLMREGGGAGLGGGGRGAGRWIEKLRLTQGRDG